VRPNPFPVNNPATNDDEIERNFSQEETMPKLTAASRKKIPTTKFAFPKQRKEPLENAAHVRNAAARFSQVEGVTAAERSAAWKRIEAAAKRYGVELSESHRKTA
jgi:hypothetical protein